MKKLLLLSIVFFLFLMPLSIAYAPIEAQQEYFRGDYGYTGMVVNQSNDRLYILNTYQDANVTKTIMMALLTSNLNPADIYKRCTFLTGPLIPKGLSLYNYSHFALTTGHNFLNSTTGSMALIDSDCTFRDWIIWRHKLNCKKKFY